MELLFVVVIMVVVAALAVPAIQQTFARQALQKGADRVRTAMGQARVRAIRNGEEYAVFFTRGGSWFNVAPFYDFQEQSNLASSRSEIAIERRQSDFEKDLLPRGVIFSGGETSQDNRAASLSGSPTGTQTDALQAVLFYPDGTAQDARLILENEKGNMIQIEVRGLTGLAKSVRVEGT